jgi:hypothetical protein
MHRVFKKKKKKTLMLDTYKVNVREREKYITCSSCDLGDDSSIKAFLLYNFLRMFIQFLGA